MKQAPRYDRQVRARFIGDAGQERIRGARVLISGAGGLGCPAAAYLAGAGVARLTLVDFDVVEVSNLHRQVFYSTADIGRPKAEVLASRLRGLNPEVGIDALVAPMEPELARSLVRSCDVVLEATDDPRARRALHAACFEAGVPYVFGAAAGGTGQLGVFRRGGGACYECFLSGTADATAATCAATGVIGTVPGAIGVLQAGEALRILVSGASPLEGKVQVHSFEDARWDLFQVRPDPGCPICASAAQRRPGAGAGTARAVALSAGEFLREWQAGSTAGGPGRYAASYGIAGKPTAGNTPLVVDVREAEEWTVSHLPRTVNVPLARLTAWEPPPEADVVLLCARGQRAWAAARELAGRGLARLRVVEGGLAACVALDPTCASSLCGSEGERGSVDGVDAVGGRAPMEPSASAETRSPQ